MATAVEAPPATKNRVVALCGPPNVGKSTLFNQLTGLRQKVANYPGITVEKKTGSLTLSTGEEIELLDLPGACSLEARSEDERIAIEVLHGDNPATPKPSATVLMLDSTNLARHLSMVPGILGLGIPTLVVLNMSDELEARGGSVDVDAISKELGAPVVAVSARHGEGVDQVHEFIEGSLTPPAWDELPVLQDIPARRKWAGGVTERASYRAPSPPEWSRRLDRWFLHPVLGPLIFLFVVLAVFQSIFTLAAPLMDSVDAAIGASGEWLGAALPEGPVRGLIVDGIWAGVGSVVIFLPQILILFLFIGILEDSGYLARAAVIADRSMRWVGLQGKSFIPLLSAYACAVPAIMAVRTIENKRDRMATLLIAPLMTCSARLPVYALLIAAFIPNEELLGPFFGTQAAVLLGLYVMGFVAAAMTAWLLKSTILKSQSTPFMLELPPYRWPTLRSLVYRLLDRSRIFLRRAGTVILATTIVLWFLASLPLQDGEPPEIGDSYAGILGKTIEPVIEPLGLNWKIGIGLITSLAAREVIVGTLGTIYGMEGSEDNVDLQGRLTSELSFGGGVALMLFFAFAMQCMSTVAIVRRETGGWKWPIIQFAYMTLLAYVSGWVAYQLFA